MNTFTQEQATAEILGALLSTKREGVPELIEHMKEIGFFTAPASAKYHGSSDGCLVIHTANVMSIALSNYDADLKAIVWMLAQNSTPNLEGLEYDDKKGERYNQGIENARRKVIADFENGLADQAREALGCSYDEVVISAILHDVGKAGFTGMPFYSKAPLTATGREPKNKFQVNKDLPLEHQDVSLMIASKFIDLHPVEMQAIKYHNGLYTADGRDVRSKENYLTILIHSADMKCAKVLEV
jgi:hypothetical protein